MQGVYKSTAIFDYQICGSIIVFMMEDESSNYGADDYIRSNFKFCFSVSTILENGVAA